MEMQYIIDVHFIDDQKIWKNINTDECRFNIQAPFTIIIMMMTKTCILQPFSKQSYTVSMYSKQRKCSN